MTLLKKALLLLPVLSVSFITACSFMPPLVSKPAEADAIVVYTVEKGLPSACKALGEVVGYGGDEEEATYDIQYNAAIDFKANAVLVRGIDDYYQNKRLRNYTRSPELFARKGTTNYTYIHPFEFKAKGMAVMCPGGNK